MSRLHIFTAGGLIALLLASCSLDTPTQIPRNNPYDGRNPNAFPEVLSLASTQGNLFINSLTQQICIRTKAATSLRFSEVADSGVAISASWQALDTLFTVRLNSGADGWRWIAAQARADNGRMSAIKYLRLGLDTRATIDFFDWTTTGGDTLIPGDHVTFTMQAADDAFGAETDGTAIATVEGWQPVALAGQADGSYTGSYTITAETPEVSNARVTVSFTDRAGNAAPNVTADQRLTAHWTPAAGEERDFPLGNTGLTVRMCWIPAGQFDMGSPANEQDRFSNEEPVHQVTFAQGFWMGKYEVTQEQWEAVMGDWGFNYDGNSDNPAERVSWNDIQDFEAALDGAFRLPSEAEWEYACRAGTQTRFYWGDDPSYSQIGTYAWYWDNSGSTTHRVGTKQANAWGLHDMSGNVYEWCEDVWHSDYVGAPDDGSAWVRGGDQGLRLLRGGSWYNNPRYCRSAYRYRYYPDYRNYYSGGFRLVSGGD